MVLKLRDDLIRCKVSKEHVESNLTHQIAYLKDRLQAIQNAKQNGEESHASDRENLRRTIGMAVRLALCYVGIACGYVFFVTTAEQERQLSQLKHDSAADEQRSKDFESVKNEYIVEKSKYNLAAEELKTELIRVREERDRLSGADNEKRLRIQTLQESLESSEHVQMDFVRMNQELQMALERIRQEQTEVRWQFDGSCARNINYCNLNISFNTYSYNRVI